MKRNHGNENSATHGIFAKILLKGNHFGKDGEYFFKLISVVHGSLRPVGGLECILIEKLAALYLRLGRLYRFNFKTASLMFARVEADLKSDHASVEAKLMSHEDQVLVIARGPSVDSIVRYESNLEKQIERTLSQLENLQRMRSLSAQPALPPAGIEVSDVEA